jgi:hypothetical protein
MRNLNPARLRSEARDPLQSFDPTLATVRCDDIKPTLSRRSQDDCHVSPVFVHKLAYAG